MSYTISLHPAVEADYLAAYSWYEDKAEGLGEKFLKAVKDKLIDIAEHPHTYGSKSRKAYREATVDVFPYIIVYKIYKRKKEVFVSAVHHAKKHSTNKYRK